jgi:hypothetical protein
MAFVVTIPAAPSEDQALDLIFQALVVGVTGLDGSLVRPRWQNPPPKQPEADTDWCAISDMGSRPDSGAGAYITHINGPSITDPAADLVVRHEELDVLASFYGPNSKANCGVLRDGLAVQQNLYGLRFVDMAFVECGPHRAAPDFVNQTWIRRWDMPLRFRRKVQRVYEVNHIMSAVIHILDDTGHVDRTVVVPPGTPIIP